MLIKLVDWNTMAIAGSRSAIAALLLIAVLRRPRISGSSAQIGGAIAYALTVLLFVAATRMTTAANAILLQYTAPVYIAIFGAWFLGEKTSVIDWLTIFVVLGGMALFFLDDLSAGGMWGNVCAILSGVSFAWLALFLRKQKAGSPLESVLLGNILAAVIGIPFMFHSAPSMSGSAALLLLGVFQLGLPYILYSSAIRHVSALEAMLLPVLEPLLNPLWVSMIVGELPGKHAILGGMVVLAALTVRSLLTLRG